MSRLSLFLLTALLTLVAAAPAGATFGSTFDPAFNGGAPVRSTGSNIYGGKSALQPDGKLVVLTDDAKPSVTDIFVTRYTTSGVPDESFGTNGVRKFTWPVQLWSEDIVVQPDGKIAVSGRYTAESAPSQTFFLRLNSDGSNDVSGFNGGFFSVGGHDTVAAVAAVPNTSDDYDVLAGGANSDPANSVGRPNLVRAKNGLTDTTFSSNLLSFRQLYPSQTVGVNDLEVQPDGKILVLLKVGTSMAVARLNNDGTLDTTFNGTGHRLLEKPDDSAALELSVLHLRSNGGIVLGGSIDGTVRDAVVAGLTSDGQLDTSFNGGNLARVSFGIDLATPGRFELVTAISENANGYLLLAGIRGDSGSATDSALAMFSPSGAQTQAFPGGSIHHDFDGSGNDDDVSSAFFRPDGRILVSGRIDDGYFVSAFAADEAPSVSITAPANASKTALPSAKLAYTTTDDNGVDPECDRAQGSDLALAIGINDFSVTCTDGSGNSASANTSVTRLPIFTLSSPKGKSVKRKSLKSISGKAPVAPKGTKIALQRIDKKLLKKKKRCLWLKNSSASFKQVKASKGGKCDKPLRLKTKVKGNGFSFALKKKRFLPKGSYKLTVTAPGVAEKVVSFKVR